MIKKIFLSLFLPLIILSCTGDDDLNLASNNIEELKNARELWQSKQIVNYSIKEKEVCFCAGILEWQLFVKNKEKNEVVFVNTTNEPTDEVYSNVFDRAKTVEDAFDLIERILSREVASFEVQYDAEYGFPTLISVDYDENIIDEERTYYFSEFEKN